MNIHTIAKETGGGMGQGVNAQIFQLFCDESCWFPFLFSNKMATNLKPQRQGKRKRNTLIERRLTAAQRNSFRAQRTEKITSFWLRQSNVDILEIGIIDFIIVFYGFQEVTPYSPIPPESFFHMAPIKTHLP